MGRRSGTPICKSCYLKDLSIPYARTKRDAVATAIRLVEPGLSPGALVTAIESAARNHHGLSTLSRQVVGNPDVLHGSCLATPIVYRLVSLLLDAGAKNVSLPRCGDCRAEAPLPSPVGDTRICEACYTRRFRMTSCSSCGKHRKIAARNDG
jgi:hypothetical protein